MLETITTRFNFDALDFAIREQLLSFLMIFSGASAELAALRLSRKKICIKVIELRENGLDHREMRRTFRRYGIEIFPADVLSFLEDSVHVLEAIADVAHLKGEEITCTKTVEHIRLIEGKCTFFLGLVFSDAPVPACTFP